MPVSNYSNGMYQLSERQRTNRRRGKRLTQLNPLYFDLSQQERSSMMNDSKERLLAAEQRLQHARRRSNLITEFFEATFVYAETRRGATHHRPLVQWVRDQVPLIESEVRLSRAGTKKRRTTDEESPEGQSQKRTRFNPEVPQGGNVQPLSRAEEMRAKSARFVGTYSLF